MDPLLKHHSRMIRGEPLKPGPKALRILYIQRGWTAKQIAEFYNCTDVQVYARIALYGFVNHPDRKGKTEGPFGKHKATSTNFAKSFGI